MAAYRATPHDATGCSPNKLVFGRENRMPIDILYGRPSGTPPPLDVNDYIRNLREDLLDSYELVRKNLKIVAETRRDRYDVGVRSCDIVEGS